MSPHEPYRQAPKIARYVCVACYRSVSVSPGSCPNCGVERLDLNREDVRADVRREVEERFAQTLAQERARCDAVGFGAGAITGVVIGALGAGLIADSSVLFWCAWTLGVIAGIGAGKAARGLYARLDPRSAIANNERIRRGLQPPPHESARMNSLLRLLGGRIDG